MADEVVGDVAEMLGDDDRVGELLEGVRVCLLDGLDEVVEPDRVAQRQGMGHASTIG
jgi:hypothetical protein